MARSRSAARYSRIIRSDGLDRPSGDGTSVVRVVSGEGGARLVLYAGQPQADQIVSYGPFIADSKQDIVRLFTEYQAGRFARLSELAKQKQNV